MPISYKGYKSRRVTSSVLAAEVIAFADMFDDAFTIRSQLQQALRKDVVMHLSTDSKCLFQIISKSSRTNEKRPMLDICATRQAYKQKQISNISFVRSERNLADGLNKPRKGKALYDLCHTDLHEIEVEQ